MFLFRFRWRSNLIYKSNCFSGRTILYEFSSAKDNNSTNINNQAVLKRRRMLIYAKGKVFAKDLAK